MRFFLRRAIPAAGSGRIACQLASLKSQRGHMLETVIREWGGNSDLWIFAYASLIWRPEFEHAEERFATIHGYHRALKMWSRLNRGTPDCPGLVFGLLHDPLLN